MRSWEQDSGTESRDAAGESKGFASWPQAGARILSEKNGAEV